MFLRSWTYAQFSLSLEHSLFPDSPCAFQPKCFLITNLKFRMDRGWGWRSLSLSPMDSQPPPTTHTSSPPPTLSTPTPGPARGGWGLIPWGSNPSARSTALFPKVAALAEMCSLACNLNLHYITSHFASKHNSKAPSPSLIHLLARWLGPPLGGWELLFQHLRPCLPLGNGKSNKSLLPSVLDFRTSKGLWVGRVGIWV